MSYKIEPSVYYNYDNTLNCSKHGYMITNTFGCYVCEDEATRYVEPTDDEYCEQHNLKVISRKGCYVCEDEDNLTQKEAANYEESNV